MGTEKGERGIYSMQEQAKKEYSFFWQQQSGLVRCNHSLSEEEVRRAVEIARTHLLPVSALGLVASKNGLRVCITREGLLWRLHNDPRGLDGIETEVIQWADESNACVAKAKCTITIGGKHFVDYAQYSRAQDTNGNVSAEEITTRCLDKAIHRAGKIASGVTLAAYEEEEDEELRAKLQTASLQ